MLLDILTESGIVLSYAGVGLVLMLIGYGIVDLLTPGKLHDLLWAERSRNAAVLVASNLLGVAIIVVTAIRASEDNFVAGLVSTFVYGVVGILIMALSFVVIDLLTPGKLGDMVHEERLNPAVWVNASAHLGISGVVAAAIF